MEKANIDKTNAWPFVEAKKILRDRKKFIDKKGLDDEGLDYYTFVCSSGDYFSEHTHPNYEIRIVVEGMMEYVMHLEIYGLMVVHHHTG